MKRLASRLGVSSGEVGPQLLVSLLQGEQDHIVTQVRGTRCRHLSARAVSAVGFLSKEKEQVQSCLGFSERKILSHPKESAVSAVYFI